jgi:bacterioferritin
VAPGSYDFKPSQKSLQPPSDLRDVAHVIRGVIDAEQGAINHHTKSRRPATAWTFVTQDMVVTISATSRNTCASSRASRASESK